MRKIANLSIFFSVLVLALVSSCKSEFEKIRTSGDPEVILKKSYEYFEDEQYQRAQTLFELILASYRGKKESEELRFKYAYTYYHLRNYILASHYFKSFAQTFATSPLRQEADFMSAYSNYQLSPSFRLDQTYTNAAIQEFQLFVNTYPDSERVEECNRLIDEMRAKLEEKAYDEALLYFNLRQYQAAIHTYENLLKDFPETGQSDRVRFMIARSSFLMAENSILQRQQERYLETINLVDEFLNKYNESAFRAEAEQIKKQSEQKLKQLENVRYQDQSARIGS